ncbi:hypothetical protein VMCG_09434 [Cytospora schulzeri]|uniref:Adenylate kinase active site lid domain-containing protein n=1 Tax=Cytospora schulzeri TaxID=448051 RepID=A0A423VKP3_9PEZI|nr:hypothetical protein VMCG_09434 [Valsa malicola]
MPTPTSTLSRRGPLWLVLGAPGSGKGTMCKRFVGGNEVRVSTKVHHISVGDLLREQKARGVLPPEVAEEVEKQILMDGRQAVEMIESAGVHEMLSRQEIVILDGFPRNMDQLHVLENQLGPPDLVISLECQRQVAFGRHLGRRDGSRPDRDVALFDKRFGEFERENPSIS